MNKLHRAKTLTIVRTRKIKLIAALTIIMVFCDTLQRWKRTYIQICMKKIVNFHALLYIF